MVLDDGTATALVFMLFLASFMAGMELRVGVKGWRRDRMIRKRRKKLGIDRKDPSI